ncbi:hypothetical protein N9124_00875 [bacterium]|mgnify:CR=1 FL=1|nr:hypothetical protein [Akkermansiaceae bacterium]MDB4288191.1 hypothetical protein [bacterium]MDA7629898.1 hypothetical protein [Akkermansiaceae bacterium]MDA7862726.1 hypothetical protein [Akkermansiaceae bacterium]MDA7863980.1 hypothetical protein [Akkermansiaceae bacterium]
MKSLTTLLLWASSLTLGLAQDAPKVLADYLTPNMGVKGEVVAVVPPEEIKPFIEKVEAGSAKNPKWFAEFSAKSKPGVPLPYDERLGLTKEEYAKYLELWDQREFKVLQPVGVRLEKLGDQWMVRVSGVGAKISLLRYDVATDSFSSPNGKMARLDDIKADPASILRGWTGHEWKFEEEGALGKTKENFAIGRTEDKKFGLLVYRLQDISDNEVPLFDQSVLIRFAAKPLKK